MLKDFNLELHKKLEKIDQGRTLNSVTKPRGRPRKVVEAVVADLVNHPAHYKSHPSNVECIQITEHMNFCLGNAVKYIWRAGLKSNSKVEDLRKARWYIDREIQKEISGK